MTEDTSKHGNEAGHGGFERRDLSAAGIIYFLLGLVAMILLASFVLTRFYDFLDKRESAQQPALSPLVTNVPTDTRHIPKDYEEKAFPAPRLEKDEHTKIDDFRLTEEQTLNSYGWVDEKTGTVRIPIERAMELIAQHGLPVRPSGVAQEKTAAKARANVGSKKEKK